MANTASAKKRVRQTEKRRLRNKAEKSRLRTQLKKFRLAVDAGDGEKAGLEYRAAVRLLDKANQNNVIHGNMAARNKSRLQKRLNVLLAS